MAAPSSCDRFGLAAYLARRGWPLVPTVGPPLCREVVEEPPLRLARGCRSAVGCGARTAAISLVQIGGGRICAWKRAFAWVRVLRVCVCVRVCSDLRVAVFMVGPARYSGAGIRLQPREHAFLLPFSTRQGFSPAWMVYRAPPQSKLVVDWNTIIKGSLSVDEVGTKVVENTW